MLLVVVQLAAFVMPLHWLHRACTHLAMCLWLCVNPVGGNPTGLLRGPRSRLITAAVIRSWYFTSICAKLVPFTCVVALPLTLVWTWMLECAMNVVCHTHCISTAYCTRNFEFMSDTTCDLLLVWFCFFWSILFLPAISQQNYTLK